MDKKQRLEQLAIASLTEEECPSPEQLAAYSLRQLTAMEELRVAAHVRTCPFCKHDIAICEVPKARPRSIFARLMPLPLAVDQRRGSGNEQIRQYVAADLIIELTIPPPIGDVWRITGQVMRGGEGLAERHVILRARRRHVEQTSDGQGFFTFESVPVGQYTLSIVEGAVQVQIRDLILSFEDR